MSVWDGLSKAAEEAPFWVHLLSVGAGVCTAVGAQKAGRRIRSWAETYDPRRSQQESDVLEALKSIEKAVREQGDATRQQLTHETGVVQSQLRSVENGVSRILGGMTIAPHSHRSGSEGP